MAQRDKVEDAFDPGGGGVRPNPDPIFVTPDPNDPRFPNDPEPPGDGVFPPGGGPGDGPDPGGPGSDPDPGPGPGGPGDEPPSTLPPNETYDPAETVPPPPPPPDTSVPSPPSVSPGDTTSGDDFIAPEGRVPDAPGDIPLPESNTGHDMEQTEWTVEDEQTVKGQLDQLYKEGSPFMDIARERAMRQAQAQGGQNSAMAAGFGEMAALDTAFKVAFEDAKTYAQSAQFNAMMSNQYSLAEQRFNHNALLSDQNYKQAVGLQTQRIAGQLEAIRMDFEGRAGLMDKELGQWFAKAAKQMEYTLQQMAYGAQLDITKLGVAHGYDLQKMAVGYSYNKALNGMNAVSNFMTNGFAQIMAAAQNGNWTPEQFNKAMKEMMGFLGSGANRVGSIWGIAASGSQSPTGGSNWYDWSNYSGTTPDYVSGRGEGYRSHEFRDYNNNGIDDRDEGG